MIEVLVALEVLAVIPLAILSLRTVKHLSEARPFAGQDDWLLRAVTRIVYYLTAITLYLIVLTAIGLSGFRLTEEFPWMRPVNGLLFLGILGCAGYLGIEIRRHRA